MIISTFFNGLTDHNITTAMQWCSTTHPHPHSRANQLEEDLKAYFDVLSGYMEEKVDYKEFREELEERRMKGITMDCKSCFWISFAGTSASGANHCQCSSLGVHADIESGQASEPRQAVGQVLEGGKRLFLAMLLMITVKVCKGLLVGEDKPDDHPDIREMRRRVLSNFSELGSLDILKEKWFFSSNAMVWNWRILWVKFVFDKTCHGLSCAALQAPIKCGFGSQRKDTGALI